eukprot:3265838-Lingulodinium_polyedra.AAC.1
MVREADRGLAEQRYKFACTEIATEQGTLCLKTGCGGLMGDPYVVHNFSRAFREPVAAWQMRLPRIDPQWRAMYARSTNGALVDLSLTKYADDLLKK